MIKWVPSKSYNELNPTTLKEYKYKLYSLSIREPIPNLVATAQLYYRTTPLTFSSYSPLKPITVVLQEMSKAILIAEL